MSSRCPPSQTFPCPSFPYPLRESAVDLKGRPRRPRPADPSAKEAAAPASVVLLMTGRTRAAI